MTGNPTGPLSPAAFRSPELALSSVEGLVEGLLVFLSILMLALPAHAWNPLQSRNGKVKSGNKKFGKEEYSGAIESYDKAALQLPDEAGVHYNRGAALFKMGAGKSAEEDSGELDRAAKAFTDAISLATEEQKDLKVAAFYNLGNVRFEQERWEEAIAAYRQALKLQPGHEDAAYNLALALKKREEQKKREEEEKKKKEQEQKEQEQKEQEQKEQEQKEQEQKEEEEQCDSGQEEKEQEQEGQGEQEQPQPEPQPGEQEQQPEPQPGEQEPVPVTQQEAEAILDALQRGEKNLTLEQLRDMHGGYGSPKVDKDW